MQLLFCFIEVMGSITQPQALTYDYILCAFCNGKLKQEGGLPYWQTYRDFVKQSRT
jgi:hypothetical protein